MKINRFQISVFIYIILVVLLLFLIGRINNMISEISSTADSIKSDQAEAIEAIRLESMNDNQVRMGQEIYTPVYPSLKAYTSNQDVDFAITLSVRNTDLKNSIIIRSVDFYRSDGERFKRFVTDPLTLGPMATKDFTVPKSDIFGGSGANFYVVWVSDVLVSEPIVEAIMLGAAPNGYSWVSVGRVVKSTLDNN